MFLGDSLKLIIGDTSAWATGAKIVLATEMSPLEIKKGLVSEPLSAKPHFTPFRN
jgi:hypothetical protein